MTFSVKKWFMLQMWRVQQIAQIVTIALLAMNLALQVYNYMSWRGSLFSSPYTGVPVLLLILAAIIWGLAIVWDMRMKMWREQMTVLAERNPYMREKMSTKELVMYPLSWLPVLESLGKTDPKAKTSAEAMKVWMRKVMREDPALSADVREVFEHIGEPLPEYLDLEKHK
jgi:hypothetical protein